MMIRISVLRQSATVLFIAIVSLVAACDDDWAKRFDTGTPLPNFRLRVQLVHDESKQELYQSFVEVSREIGFTKYEGQPIDDPSFKSDPKIKHSFSWVPGGPKQGRYGYLLTLIWDSRDPPKSFELVFSNKDIDDLGETEWRYYKRIRTEILSSVYPGARIVTLTHPAAFTSPEASARLATLLGIELPAKSTD